MIKNILPLLTSVAAIAFTGGSAWGFSLVGSELKLRTEAQLTPTSQLFVTSFPASATVSESAVEFPNVESLFDPTVGVPPGFARSLVNVAIDAGADYLEIDFDNAGFGSYAPGFKNTYVFSFTAPLALRITSVVIDPRTNLGLTPDRVTFNGNELFVNVQRLFFNRNSFARFNLTTVAESGPGGENPSDPDTVAVPEPSSMLLMGGAALMGAAFKRHRARQQSERTPVS